MYSWLVNVQCKEKFKDPGNFKAHTQGPNLGDFDYTGEREDIKDIGQFISKYGVDFSVLNVDLDLELLILVKTVESNLKEKPFLYAAQRVSATQLLCIPFQELEKVEEVIVSKVSSVKTSFLYSTGRCGSTLLCKALDQLPTVQSISEPDVFTALALYYDDNVFSSFPTARIDKKVLVKVTRVTTFLLNYYFLTRFPEKTNICYKLRCETIEGAELLQKAMPDAKNIYLYRNCLGYAESMVRLVLRNNYALYWLLSTLRIDSIYMWFKFKYQSLGSKFFEYMGNAVENENAPFRRGFFWCSSYYWWRNIEKAVALAQQDSVNFFHVVLKYEDLSTRKEEMIWIVAKNLGFVGELDASVVGSMPVAFQSNSQTGTVMASKRNVDEKDDLWFGTWEEEQINGVLQFIGNTVRSGDFVMPGTL